MANGVPSAPVPNPAGQRNLNAGQRLNGRSRALLLFCGLHVLIMSALVLNSRAGLSADPWQRVLLGGAYFGNAALLWRNWRAARAEPPSPIVQERIRLHLRLLRAARCVLMVGLATSVPLAAYFAWHAEELGAQTSYVRLVPVLVCPLLLGLKLRWLAVWQRRLRHKAALAAV